MDAPEGGTLIRAADSAGLADAVRLLSQGRLVGLPTETVYGLACDASNPVAVARVFAAKGRPAFNPLIAHCDSLAMAQQQGVFDNTAARLAEAFWPGPLTLVVPLSASHQVCDLARAGLASVALRVPAHPVMRAVIAGLGRPVAAPSANLSGRVSATSAAHVEADLAGRIDLILDAGSSTHGLESTIIACLGGAPALLRSGAIPADAIRAVLGPDVPLRAARTDPDAPIAPGGLLRHYAPAASLRLNVSVPEPDEAWLAFGPLRSPVPQAAEILSLSETGDLVEAASRLFAFLRSLDARHSRIAVAPIPDTELGEAINDRLRRAATR